MDARVQAHERPPRAPVLLELVVIEKLSSFSLFFFPSLELGVRCAFGVFTLSISLPFQFNRDPRATLDPSNNSGARAENG